MPLHRVIERASSKSPCPCLYTPSQELELFLFPLTLGGLYNMSWTIGFSGYDASKTRWRSLHLCCCPYGAPPWGPCLDKLRLIHTSAVAHMKQRHTVSSLRPLGLPAASQHQASVWVWSHSVSFVFPEALRLHDRRRDYLSPVLTAKLWAGKIAVVLNHCLGVVCYAERFLIWHSITLMYFFALYLCHAYSFFSQ